MNKSTAIWIAKNKDQISELDLNNNTFKKRDLDLLNQNESLWQILINRGLVNKQSYDEDLQVHKWRFDTNFLKYIDNKIQ